MNDIELADKCGFIVHRSMVFVATEGAVDLICIDSRLREFADAIRKDQIEKDAKICDELQQLTYEDGADESWQHGECASAIRNQLRKEDE